MSRKVLSCALVGAVCLLVLFGGCAPQAELALKFNVGDQTKYTITEEDSQDFKFEQPSLDKVRFEPRMTTSQIRFLQEIESVDEKTGAAVAKITIKAFKYFAKDKDEVKFNFDSSREGAKNKPLSKLLGKSYKIKLGSDGGVEVLEAENIRKAVTGGQARRVAQAFLDNKSIQKRHKIESLPDADKSLLQTGDSWTRVETPQKRLMVPKAFEKTYTFKKVTGQGENQIAVVNMNADESPTTPVGAQRIAGGIGLFANMFDTDETYTGQMVLELATGKVAKYNEKFVTTYTAAEPSAKQKPDKGPDMLTIQLTYSTALEMLD